MRKYVNLKNTAVLFFILYYIAGLLCLQVYYRLDLDENAGENSKVFFEFIRNSLEQFGLYAGWGYFSEVSKDEYTHRIVGTTRGYSVDYIPDFQKAGFKFKTEKDRKFHIKIKRYSDIRTSYLKSFCVKFEREHGRKFNKVTFYKYKKPIPEPGSSGPTKMRQVRKWSVKC